MTTAARRRGPRRRLPARVYWVRRTLVLAMAMALVLGLAHLLGGGSGDPVGASARPVGAPAGSVTGTTAGTEATGAVTPRAGQGRKAGKHGKHGKQATPSPTPLAMPTGPCQDQDVVVTPAVSGTAYAGSPVTFTLVLTTKESPACTWTASPRTVVVRLTSGTDRIWSTQDCKAALHRQDVVVRKDVPTEVSVTWRGQRSDGSCSRTTPWAQPGFYHATAASLGGEPADMQFELQEPRPETITPSPSPSPSAEPHGKGAHGRGADSGGKKRGGDGHQAD